MFYFLENSSALHYSVTLKGALKLYIICCVVVLLSPSVYVQNSNNSAYPSRLQGCNADSICL